MKYILSLLILLLVAVASVRAQALPAVSINADTKSTDLPPAERFPSPNGKLMLTTQKYVSSISVAILYKRVNGGAWQSATVGGLRFDEAAWRWWAAQKKGRAVPSMENGPRLLRFARWSPDGKFVDFELQGTSVTPARMRYNARTGAFSLR